MPGKRVMGFLAVGLAAGVLSGLFGVGGGVVIVPLLVFAFAFPQKRAQATSLTAIIVIAGAAAVAYALSEQTDWVAAGVIAAGGVVGSYLGSGIARRVPDTWLRIVFAAVALATAVELLLPGPGGAAAAPQQATASVGAAAMYAGAGLAMGVLSALVGVGGGVILVPLLVMALGVPQHSAQGLSLVVMVPVALTGAIRGARSGNTQWKPGLLIGLGGALAAPFAAQLALHLPTEWMRRLFALLLIVTAANMAWRSVRQLQGRRRKRHSPGQEA